MKGGDGEGGDVCVNMCHHIYIYIYIAYVHVAGFSVPLLLKTNVQGG